jgi:hypothetical protein
VAEGLHERLLAELDRLDPHRLTTLGKVADAVVKLHAPSDTYPNSTIRIGWTACCGCECSGYEWEYPDYPCSTICTIAEALGVPLEAENRG